MPYAERRTDSIGLKVYSTVYLGVVQVSELDLRLCFKQIVGILTLGQGINALTSLDVYANIIKEGFVMKLKKRIAAMGAAVMMAVSMMSIGASASNPNIEAEDVYMSKNKTNMNYSVVLSGKDYFDYSWSDDGYYQTLCYVYRKGSSSSLYRIRGFYLDNKITSDRIATYTKIDNSGKDKYHSCTIISGGNSKNSGKATNKTVTDHTDFINLKNNKATFQAEYYIK